MNILRRAWGKAEGFWYLLRLARAFSNWRDIWSALHGRRALPPLCLRGGVRLHHGPEDGAVFMLHEIFMNRWYDIEAQWPVNALVIDLGANIGFASLFFNLRSPTARIHAYDPNPAAYALLQRNVTENGLHEQIQMFPEAVGRAAGTLGLWIDVPTYLSTGYLDHAPESGGRRISVPVVGLDEVWRRANRQPVWLLKIDTQGAEGDILEGASSEVLAAVQHVVIETHDDIIPGVLTRCRRVLDAAGFTIWRSRQFPRNEVLLYARR